MDKLLEQIRDNPVAHLPEISLSLLNTFLKGYNHRREAKKVPPVKVNEGFANWLGHRFSFRLSAVSTPENMVLSFSSSDHDAFYKYFELLEEFDRSDLPRSPSTWINSRKGIKRSVRQLLSEVDPSTSQR